MPKSGWDGSACITHSRGSRRCARHPSAAPPRRGASMAGRSGTSVGLAAAAPEWWMLSLCAAAWLWLQLKPDGAGLASVCRAPPAGRNGSRSPRGRRPAADDGGDDAAAGGGLRRYAAFRSLWRRRHRAIAVFLCGYLAVWLAAAGCWMRWPRHGLPPSTTSRWPSPASRWPRPPGSSARPRPPRWRLPPGPFAGAFRLAGRPGLPAVWLSKRRGLRPQLLAADAAARRRRPRSGDDAGSHCSGRRGALSPAAAGLSAAALLGLALWRALAS
ncbi:Uncharacterised protein [Chromobacterium violaceum]|uniref:Uncharacterized protein n=1 Tax=Chromobacterium violaceum TaxID=536 RepID=A0A447THA2_CHRVL|nr:Uncharacterised protein [Chromobacterium violaceum]